jgi:hypothetical protein
MGYVWLLLNLNSAGRAASREISANAGGELLSRAERLFGLLALFDDNFGVGGGVLLPTERGPKQPLSVSFRGL